MSSVFKNEHFQYYNTTLKPFSYNSWLYLITNYLVFRSNKFGYVTEKILHEVAINHGFTTEQSKKYWLSALKKKSLHLDMGSVSIPMNVPVEEPMKAPIITKKNPKNYNNIKNYKNLNNTSSQSSEEEKTKTFEDINWKETREKEDGEPDWEEVLNGLN